MVKVANLSADLTANTSTFDARLQRSSNTLRRTGRQMSRNAEGFSKRVSNSFRNVSRNVALIEGPLGGVAGRLTALSAISGTSGVAILGITGAIAALGTALAKTIRVSDTFEGSMNRVEAIIKATGGAAGITADEIRTFSQELARGTLASVEGVEAAAAKLLTFRSISGETFKRTLRLAQDLAATGFGSLSDNVTQLGKALEDPIRNLGALTRNGVSFTQQQKDVIKALVETGEAAQAQQIILDALAQQVAGAGSAEGGIVSKAFDSLTQSVDNFFIALDDRTGAGSRFAEFLKDVDEGVQSLTETLDPADAPLIEQLNAATEQLGYLIAQTTEEYKYLTEREGLTHEQAMQNIDFQIEAQRKVIAEIEARIKAEEEKAEAVKKAAEAEQARIAVDAEAGRVEEARKKRLQELEKIEENRQKQVRTTIDNLRNAVEGLQTESDLLKANTISVDEAATAREVLGIQLRLGISDMDAEGQVIDALIVKRNELTKTIKDERDQRERIKQILRDNKTEQQRLNEELAEFKQLRDDNLLTEQQYQEAVTRTKDKLQELDEGYQELQRTTEEVGDATSTMFKDLIFGADKASDAVRNLGLRLAEMIFDQTAGKFLSKAVGGIAESLFGGFFAAGGRPPVGRVSVVGEEGPELFVPDTAGTIIPNAALSEGGNGGPTIYADLRGASVEAVQRLETFVNQLNGSIEPRAIDAVVSEKQRNPALFEA